MWTLKKVSFKASGRLNNSPASHWQVDRIKIGFPKTFSHSNVNLSKQIRFQRQSFKSIAKLSNLKRIFKNKNTCVNFAGWMPLICCDKNPDVTLLYLTLNILFLRIQQHVMPPSVNLKGQWLIEIYVHLYAWCHRRKLNNLYKTCNTVCDSLKCLKWLDPVFS